ncbi:MAG: shikimate kinase [Acidimicrobiales bacterium]
MTRVLLVGMPGAGKSTTGRIVADRLGWKHVDTDAEVSALAGRSIPEIFSAEGEEAFRARECAVIGSVLSGESSMVVSLGGGAVVDPVNRAAVGRSGMVVWLRAEPETLVERVGDAGDRPVVSRGGGAGASLARLDVERRPYYAEVAEFVVDVDRKTPEEVADEVLARVRTGAR